MNSGPHDASRPIATAVPRIRVCIIEAFTVDMGTVHRDALPSVPGFSSTPCHSVAEARVMLPVGSAEQSPAPLHEPAHPRRHCEPPQPERGSYAIRRRHVGREGPTATALTRSSGVQESPSRDPCRGAGRHRPQPSCATTLPVPTATAASRSVAHRKHWLPTAHVPAATLLRGALRNSRSMRAPTLRCRTMRSQGRADRPLP